MAGSSEEHWGGMRACRLRTCRSIFQGLQVDKSLSKWSLASTLVMIAGPVPASWDIHTPSILASGQQQPLFIALFLPDLLLMIHFSFGKCHIFYTYVHLSGLWRMCAVHGHFQAGSRSKKQTVIVKCHIFAFCLSFKASLQICPWLQCSSLCDACAYRPPSLVWLSLEIYSLIW